jgi:predicted PurR-regulated permease PerM
VLSPIIIGIAIAYILNPILKLYEYKILRRLKNKGLRRSLSLILTYITILLVISAFLWLVIPQLIDSLKNLTGEFDSYVASTVNVVNSLINRFSQNHEFVTYFNEDMFFEYLMKFFNTSDDIFNTVLNYLTQFGSGIFTGITDAILGIFISIYMLVSKERLHAQIRRITAAIFKEKTRNHLLRYTRIANRTFGGFFIGTLVDALFIAIITFITLSIFRIPYAILVSVIVGITNIIPIFGPFIGAIPSTLILLMVSPFDALIFVAFVLALQQFDGNILGPYILGDVTKLNSFWVLFAILLFGGLFGIVGMVVGVPIFAFFYQLLREWVHKRLGDPLEKQFLDKDTKVPENKISK